MLHTSSGETKQRTQSGWTTVGVGDGGSLRALLKLRSSYQVGGSQGTEKGVEIVGDDVVEPDVELWGFEVW